MNDKILVTGCNGFIGSHVAEFYAKKGYQVIGIGRENSSLVKNIKYYQKDLLIQDLIDILSEHRPSIIIHCAGVADVNYSRSHADEDLNMNYFVSRKLLLAICKTIPETKVLLLSSAAVYGNVQSLPIVENTPYQAISPYALHKVLMEITADYFVRLYGIDVRILRVFSAYGGGLRKQIFWDMAQKYKKEHHLDMGGTGNETRDFIHIYDLVRAIKIIADAPKTDIFIYNIANGIEISIRSIVNLFASAIENKLRSPKINIMFNEIERTGNPLNWCADISRIESLGYKSKISISEGINEYIDWLIEIGEL